VTKPPLVADTLEGLRTESLRLRSAVVDRTTGLPAYAFLTDALRGLLETRRQLGVLHAEIPDLDLVESLYGWQVFDRIVAKVAGHLRESVGALLPTEALLSLAGVGSDRFVVFAPNAPGGASIDLPYLENAARALERHLAGAFDTREFDGLNPRIHFRIGTALLTENPFFRFERRVHAAVEAARSQHARRETGRRASWEGELHRLIEEAGISTFLQPVVDLETGGVLGYEALARGPEGSALEAPAALFAVAERAGVQRELDRLCRDTALGALGSIPSGNKLFVNALPASLEDADWHDGTVRDVVRLAGHEPGDLIIEVSERKTDPESDLVAAASERIRALGFGLALDDVGTGFGTLATLERVRPDYLKMDTSLVRGVHDNFIKQELLASVVQLGRRIEAPVIAEGIESPEETQALRAAGARYGQGFLYARPTRAKRPV